MTAPRDPLSRLRDADPMRSQEAPSPDSPHARALLERIVASPPEPQAARGRNARRALLVLVPAIIVALGAAGYGFYQIVTEPLVIACYGQMNGSGNVSAQP